MSLNDPQWGKKGGGNGPPDLEELWRNFNQKLNGMFGKRGGSGAPSAQPPNLRKIGGGIGMLVALVLVLWLASGFYIVDEKQRGVVFSFGKQSDLTSPGLRWRLPYPFQSHEIVNLSQVRTVEVGYRNTVKTKVLKESIMLTDDENIIDIQFAVQYTLKDPLDYLFNNKKPDDTVLQAAETAFREVVGSSKMDFVLYEGREQVAIAAQKQIQDILDRYKTGIAVSRVTMQNAQPPEQVQAAFDDAVKAKQDLERQKSEGQAYFNDVVPKARGAASRLTEEAQGYRQRVLANAEGEASRFKQVLAEYNKAPQVMRDRMYLETVQQIMSSTSKILLDAKGGGNLLYLPLDKIMQMSAGALPEAVPPSSKQTLIDPTPNPDPAARSRDALRGRERESRP
ncbi:MAG: HflK protein [Betaproteobacteria bacterium RIFCSPLOWO2_02_FULL_65_24]|nr:MAG: HflK protein [Betaproteobacteria bacterium RIFCSPLOWO2_02_FULL_65_24]